MRNRIYQQLKPLRKKYEKLEAELEENLVEQEFWKSNWPIRRPTRTWSFRANWGSAFATLQNRAEDLMSDLAYLEKELQELEIQRDA
jgi:ATP-binding cassette, subfamily F, member 3